MDIVIIFLIAAGVIALVLLSVKGYSLLMTWRIANKHGLHASFVETIALSKFYELDEAFLRTCVAFKKLDPAVSVREIVHHHMADGDTNRLLDKWAELKKRNLKIPFESAILYDLSNKDIIAMASRVEEVHELQLDELVDKSFHVTYECQFKINPESAAWITPDLDQYRATVFDIIKSSLLNGNQQNLPAIKNEILNQALDKKFWQNLCHGEVINQELSILMR